MYMYVHIKLVHNEKNDVKSDKGGKKGSDVKGVRRGEG